MIDAGSSGSRAYLYAWPSHSGDMHELLKIRPLVLKIKSNENSDVSSSSSVIEEPLVEKVTPGLSRYLDFFRWYSRMSKSKIFFLENYVLT